MMDKNSAEYKTVVNLYNDGRITAEERDKLLTALGYDDERRSAAGKLPDADKIFSDDDDIYVDLTDGDDEEEEDDDEPDGFHISIDDERSLGEFLSGLGKKISGSVKFGLRTASDALDKTSARLSDAAKSITAHVADELKGFKYDGVVEKKRSKSYDVPYDELEIEVYYSRGGDVYTVCDSASCIERIKAELIDKIEGEAARKLSEILDGSFTGKYKYIRGDEILKVTVAPPQNDD